tara:strand:- start:1471 stop:1812 length:342 start_codon:yes stop_codon:yes gene_type:complete
MNSYDEFIEAEFHILNILRGTPCSTEDLKGELTDTFGEISDVDFNDLLAHLQRNGSIGADQTLSGWIHPVRGFLGIWDVDDRDHEEWMISGLRVPYVEYQWVALDSEGMAIYS